MVAIDRFSFLAKCYFKFACNCWECWLHASRTDCQKSQEAGQKLASSRAYTAATLVRLLIALDVAALGVEKYCVSGSVGRSVRRTWVKGHLASWGADYWGLHRSKRLVFKIKLWLHLILPNFHFIHPPPPTHYSNFPHVCGEGIQRHLIEETGFPPHGLILVKLNKLPVL